MRRTQLLNTTNIILYITKVSSKLHGRVWPLWPSLLLLGPVLGAQHLGGDRTVGPAAQRHLHVLHHVVPHAELPDLVGVRVGVRVRVRVRARARARARARVSADRVVLGDDEQCAQPCGEGDVQADEAVVPPRHAVG